MCLMEKHENNSDDDNDDKKGIVEFISKEDK